jgi:hypothetical protein
MNSWMNANAGAAVMVSINAETKAAASKTDSFLLNKISLYSSPFEGRASSYPP